MKYLIDKPSPFASTTHWRQFLEEMRTIPLDDPQVSEAVKQAEAVLRDREESGDGL